MAETLNSRIKSLRKEKGMTQLELAVKLSITDKAVSKWESGDGNPDISLLPILAKIFDVSIDYLLTGTQEDKISLDDMEPKKRLEYLITNDDIDGLIKYGYDKPPHRKSTSIFGPPVRFSNISILSINEKAWKNVLDNNADNIFKYCCTILIETQREPVSLAFLMIPFLDKVVKKCIELDFVEMIEALGVRYFGLGKNQNYPLSGRKAYLLPAVYTGEYTSEEVVANISESTFDYFFKMAEKSPKCFSYITKCELNIKSMKQDRNGNLVEFGARLYTATSLYNKLFLKLIEYEILEVLEDFLKVLKEELKQLKIHYNGGYLYPQCYARDTFIICRGSDIVGRLVTFSEEAVFKLCDKNRPELAKKVLTYNKEANDKISPYGLKIPIFETTEAEIDRRVALLKNNISKEDRFTLEAVSNHIIRPQILKNCRDLKLVRNIIDNYYFNYYELVYDLLSTGNIKKLFEFFVDNGLDAFAVELMAGKTSYTDLLRDSWNSFAGAGRRHFVVSETLLTNQNKTSLDRFQTGNLKIDSENAKIRTAFIKEHGTIEKCCGMLSNNPIILFIKTKKEEIYEYVEASIEAEKKIKEDAIEREKIAKGLTLDYFNGLLTKAQTDEDTKELFIIKLCALQDAIFLYDFHYDGEDYSARMNQHFKSLESSLPKLQGIDDGWGYVVNDVEWENTNVIPARQRWNLLKDLFYKLRVTRNNISHGAKDKVEELSIDELRMCLDFIFGNNNK